jgi:hypothetical protein
MSDDNLELRNDIQVKAITMTNFPGQVNESASALITIGTVKSSLFAEGLDWQPDQISASGLRLEDPMPSAFNFLNVRVSNKTEGKQ